MRDTLSVVCSRALCWLRESRPGWLTAEFLERERLSTTPDGRIVAFEPMVFVERLAALIPRPRVNLVTYHGILAPAAGFRDRIVPVTLSRPSAPGTTEPKPKHGRPRTSQAFDSRRYTWAQLMRRVFEFDVLVCHWCGGARRVLTFLTDPIVIHRILIHLGLGFRCKILARMPRQFADDQEAPNVAPAQRSVGEGRPER